MHKEMPWPLTAGVLLALLLQIPRQLSVAETLQRNQPPAPLASETTDRADARSTPNPLRHLSQLLGVIEGPD